jgi:putative ABC transport system permease protein
MGLNHRLAWRNIWRHPRRTGLTLAAIVFSDAILVWMIGLQLGQYDMMIDNTLRSFIGHVQIQAKGYQDKPQIYNTIPNAALLASQIRENPNTPRVGVRAIGFALASSETRSYGAQITGVQPEYEHDVSTIPGLIKQGRYLGSEKADEAVIGSVMARNLKLKLGDELTFLGSGKDGSFAAAVLPVIGIFESGSVDIDRFFIQIPLGTFQNIFSMGNDAHSIVVTGVNHQQTPLIKSTVQAIVGSNTKLDVLDWERLQPGLRQAIQADFSTAWLMYGVLVVLVAFSVLNTFLMSVLERTREFGIMLALGLTPGKIGRMVMIESFTLATFGLILGMIAGSILTSYFMIYGFSYPGMEEMAAKFNLPDRFYPKLNVVSITLGPMVIFVSTLIAALWPAIRIHLLKPVEAMQTV